MENLIGKNVRITFQRKTSQWHSFDVLRVTGGFVLLRGIGGDGFPSRSTFWQQISAIDTLHPRGEAVSIKT